MSLRAALGRGLAALRRRAGDAWARLRAKRVEPPSAPRRFAEEVELAVLRSRTWTAPEWAAFAQALAEGAYADGYRQGFEEGVGVRRRAEQDARQAWSVWDSAEAERARRRGGDLSDPLAGVPAEEAVAFVDALGKHSGAYRIVDGAGRRIIRDEDEHGPEDDPDEHEQGGIG